MRLRGNSPAGARAGERVRARDTGNRSYVFAEFGSNDWWEDILEFSHQDQLSFPVCMEKYKGQIRFNTNLPWHTDWSLQPHLPPPGA